MASASMMNFVNAAKHHPKVLSNHSNLVPKKFRAVQVTKSSLGAPFIAGKLTTTSQKNLTIPELQIDEYITQKAKQINKALDEAVPLKHPMMLYEAMRYTLLAGRNRVQPTLCIASCESVGGTENLAMPTACAVEMILTMSEIQDDLPCLDNDDLRRGKPANHKVFGEGTSVLACQGLTCLAIEHIITNTKNVSPDRLHRAIVEICSGLGSEGIAAGQIMDINSEGKEVSLSELEFIHRHKTSKFLEASVVCGALLGGGNNDEIERIRIYGKCLGMAYQVWDDILDVTGTTEELGKKVGRDLLRDKATYPKLMGMDEAKKYARDLVAKAIEELTYLDSTKAAPLYHMANFIVSRQY